MSKLFAETDISSTARLINALSKQTPNSSESLRSKSSKIKVRNSTDLFWDIIGRDNYTISLNQSPVLCNSSLSSAPNFFGIPLTSVTRDFNSLPWRSKRLPQRVVPTMVPNKNDSAISLLTKTIKSGASSLVSAIYTSTIEGDWENYKLSMPGNPLTLPREETHSLPQQDVLEPVEFVGRYDDTDPVLTEKIADAIRPRLSRRLRYAPRWNLLYSLDQDGTSMSTLYYKVKDKSPLVLAIKDMDDQVFGAFVTEPFRPHPSYYGTGECFLWKSVEPQSNISSKPEIKIYLWTGRNEYMILSENNYLSIGGGNGKVGLLIDSDLQRGHSERCDTFDNDVLSSTSEFECMGLEIWGFNG
ncbi:16821_t:CDS:2 [Acaulospora morrowiae]|uniref:Oxidation resistance protein 1 n=1 Tax=Acaulospora morrowiae TaxID=94023 RepID=A0A9N8VG48_9GLOM|nr:16821_t:CDS:2 [Acaulospora morrowiae]